MLFRLFIVLMVTIVITTLPGCKKASDSVPTEKKVEITEENLDSELDKMEKEIEADIATE